MFTIYFALKNLVLWTKILYYRFNIVSYFETLSLGLNLGVTSVNSEMVDFGFRQGPSEFLPAGIARYVED